MKELADAKDKNNFQEKYSAADFDFKIYPCIFNRSILQLFEAIDNMNVTLQKKLEMALKPTHLVGFT